MANNVYDNFQQFFKQQVKNFAEARVPAKVLREAAINSAVEVKDRVQQKGMKSDMTSLPPYSTNPFARPRGIRGKGKIKFYPGGYKEFRESNKKQTNHMDLTLSDDMFNSWLPKPVDQTSYGVTFVSPEMRERAGYHETRFGDIFSLSPQEEQDALTSINTNAIKYLSR
jgi:hypothetical protein